MADKEVGLYQIRTGKQRNLPTSLEHGELALTTDQCRVFVGLPATVTPASLVSGRRKNNNSGSDYVVPGSGEENVEILTEFSPASVLDRVLYKPKKVTVPANSSYLISIPGTSRLFLEYVSYPSTYEILESGQSQIAVITDNSGKNHMLLSQQNNTNDDESEPLISLDPNSLSLTGTQLSVRIQNDSIEPMIFEYVTRGWHG